MIEMWWWLSDGISLRYILLHFVSHNTQSDYRHQTNSTSFRTTLSLNTFVIYEELTSVAGFRLKFFFLDNPFNSSNLPEISASFFFRVHFLSCFSRIMAGKGFRNCSAYTTITGNRLEV